MITPPLHESLNASVIIHNQTAHNNMPISIPVRSIGDKEQVSTAIVYCEANFGAIDGKTANGLVRHSERYKILSVIDSEMVGFDAGMVLDDKPNAIPTCRDLAGALALAGTVPDYFIYGMAPSSGMLSIHERSLILEAMGHGMNIVNGLHEFLNDDPLFEAACAENKVKIIDVRKPRRDYYRRARRTESPRLFVVVFHSSW
ncbi:MAG: hypothetical protein DHS20C01_36350 [marine bacterium B5-7]|nr:MAG: hypothetical protein DHS20C01_36350 [marine bacterium B5-7]